MAWILDRKVNETVCSKIGPVFRGKNGFEVHAVRTSGPHTAKICSSVAAKYDFSPLVTLDFELVL